MLLSQPTHCFFVSVYKVDYLSIQAPVFISFFIALRKMAYLPVPSLQTGGLLWFPDLTAADPFYILPLAVTGTMFFILEVRHPSSRQLVACDWPTDLTCSLNVSHSAVGRRVWYRQSQPASHEDGVQGHAFYHPPSDHQLPYGQPALHSRDFFFFVFLRTMSSQPGELYYSEVL